MLRVHSHKVKVNANAKAKNFLLWHLALLDINTSTEINVRHFSKSDREATFVCFESIYFMTLNVKQCEATIVVEVLLKETNPMLRTMD